MWADLIIACRLEVAWAGARAGVCNLITARKLEGARAEQAGETHIHVAEGAEASTWHMARAATCMATREAVSGHGRRSSVT